MVYVTSFIKAQRPRIKKVVELVILTRDYFLWEISKYESNYESYLHCLDSNQTPYSERLGNLGKHDLRILLIWYFVNIKNYLIITPWNYVKETQVYFFLITIMGPDDYTSTLRYKKTYWRYDYMAMANHYLKKYVYTINHKRIGLSYLYFCLFSGLSGAMLAAFIRLELAYPGSHFFKGDSVRYIQVISAHGLIMIFYVVVPVVFGLFANYFIPFHIQSKDVAFPRLNSIGF
jgi:hypothetical protein